MVNYGDQMLRLLLISAGFMMDPPVRDFFRVCRYIVYFRHSGHASVISHSDGTSIGLSSIKLLLAHFPPCPFLVLYCSALDRLSCLRCHKRKKVSA
jgi:hypothetical protein